MHDQLNRRNFLRNTIAASVGTAFLSLEEKTLLAYEQDSAPPQKSEKSGVPVGKIGPVSMSRLICGENLITGSAHARDLMYVSNLLRAYFTDEKIMETWSLCEENGINTIIAPGHTDTHKLLHRYWNERRGWIQYIEQGGASAGAVQGAKDRGAVGVFVNGGIVDRLSRQNRMEEIAEGVEKAHELGMIFGVAGHELRTAMAVEKTGIDVDFYAQTLHSNNYWSRKRPDQVRDITDWDGDNYFCRDAKKTIDFMGKIKKPWMAYKVLAAGAIHPIQAFDYASKNGADFILVGMFDFQVIEDAIIARQAIARNQVRQRPWLA